MPISRISISHRHFRFLSRFLTDLTRLWLHQMTHPQTRVINCSIHLIAPQQSAPTDENGPERHHVPTRFSIPDAATRLRSTRPATLSHQCLQRCHHLAEHLHAQIGLGKQFAGKDHATRFLLLREADPAPLARVIGPLRSPAPCRLRPGHRPESPTPSGQTAPSPRGRYRAYRTRPSRHCLRFRAQFSALFLPSLSNRPQTGKRPASVTDNSPPIACCDSFFSIFSLLSDN